jgi:hypothetical protein
MHANLLPLFVKETRVYNLMVLQRNQTVVANVRIQIRIRAAPIVIAKCVTTIDDHVPVRVQRIRKDEYRHVSGSIHSATSERDLFFGPLDGQLADNFRNQLVAPGIAKQDQVVVRNLTQ